MKRIENFQWNDVVLFSKGWYVTTGDLFHDMELSIRENKNYCYIDRKMTEREVIHWLFKILDDFYEYLTEEEKKCRRFLVSHLAFMEEVNRREDLYRISRNKAIVLTIMNIFLLLNKEEIILNKPVYCKGRRRIGGAFCRYPISMTYKHMNDIASKIFDN
jgi:hypothetical protein